MDQALHFFMNLSKSIIVQGTCDKSFGIVCKMLCTHKKMLCYIDKEGILLLYCDCASAQICGISAFLLSSMVGLLVSRILMILKFEETQVEICSEQGKQEKKDFYLSTAEELENTNSVLLIRESTCYNWWVVSMPLICPSYSLLIH